MPELPEVDQPPAARRPWRMPSIIIGIMTLGVLLIGVAGLTVALALRFQGDSEYESYVAQTEAAGYPTSLDDLNAWYADVPNDQNAALPLQEAFDAFEPYSRTTVQLPWIAGKHAPGIPLSEETLREAQSHLADNERTLALVADALTRPDCRFPVDFTAGPAVSLPHLSDMRTVARLLALQATVRAAQGDGAGAAKSVQRILSLAECLKSEPVLISQLVRVAIRFMACDALEDVMWRTQLPADALVVTQTELAEAEDPEWFVRALVGEQAIAFSFWRDAQQNESVFSTLGWMFGVVQRYRNTHFGMMQSVMEVAALPAPERDRRLDAIIDQLNEQSAFLPQPYPDLPQQFARASENDQRSLAKLRIARLACAIERYRIAENSIPDGLYELAPAYIGDVPEDPYTGDVLGYRTLPNGYVVYAVGANGADDTAGADENAIPVEDDVAFVVKRNAD